MTERRLPRALQMQVIRPDLLGGGYIVTTALLDWLYGKDGGPDIVERARQVAMAKDDGHSMEFYRNWLDALDQELGTDVQ